MFPLSVAETKAMEEYVEQALWQRLIKISRFTLPASAGFFFMDKKDRGLQSCIDYRGLNSVTIKYPHPLPVIPSAIEQHQVATVFTWLDLQSAYNLICIQVGDEWKTGFSTTSGHYEYNVMAYGLVNVPYFYQAFMNDVFRDMLNRYVIFLY